MHLSKKAILVLEDGRAFRGESFGAEGESFGEMVFNTSMTGYQEILTDPSYAGQIVCMTYPLIGNYGVNEEDSESRRPWVEGFVVREASKIASNWRSTETLDSYLKRHKIIGIEKIDTVINDKQKFSKIYHLPLTFITTAKVKCIYQKKQFWFSRTGARFAASLSVRKARVSAKWFLILR
jgi:hypothetical protein